MKIIDQLFEILVLQPSSLHLLQEKPGAHWPGSMLLTYSRYLSEAARLAGRVTSHTFLPNHESHLRAWPARQTRERMANRAP